MDGWGSTAPGRVASTILAGALHKAKRWAETEGEERKKTSQRENKWLAGLRWRVNACKLRWEKIKPEKRGQNDRKKRKEKTRRHEQETKRCSILSSVFYPDILTERETKGTKGKERLNCWKIRIKNERGGACSSKRKKGVKEDGGGGEMLST